MKTRLISSYCLLLMLATGLVIFPGCRKDSDEDKIKKRIVSIQEAAENRDVREMLAHISKRYGDPQGNDYEGIKGIIVFYFFRHQKISIFLNNLEIAVNGLSAEAAFEAILSGGGSAGTILPEALGIIPL